jgi:hypothetical protein
MTPKGPARPYARRYANGYSDYRAREVSWIVWARAGRIVMASRYAGRNRAMAVREFHGMRADTRLSRLPSADPLGRAGMSWRSWSARLRHLS